MSGPARRRARLALVGLRRLALVAALLGLLLGIGNRDQAGSDRVPQLAVLVAIDRTTSMSALDDPSGSRITAVRRDLAQLGDDLDNASFSVVTFGTSTDIAIPFTTDRVAYRAAVRSVQVEKADAGSGTSIDRAVPFLSSQLALALDSGADPDPGQDLALDGDRIPVLVLVTDGENTAPEAGTPFTGLTDQVGAGVVLGYGTTAGGEMPLKRVPLGEDPPPASRPGKVVTVAGTRTPALSHLDPATLTSIAAQAGIGYVPCDGTQSMAAVAAQLQAAAYADLPPVEPQRERRWLWALAVLLLVVPELRGGWRHLLETLRERR